MTRNVGDGVGENACFGGRSSCITKYQKIFSDRGVDRTRILGNWIVFIFGRVLRVGA